VTTPQYPAAYSAVVSVAASDSNDQKASFSNYGSRVDIVAPGTAILSTLPSGAYGLQQ
jgi:subtilisin family serine protease